MSSSEIGIGSGTGSLRSPSGMFRISSLVGKNAQKGMDFKALRATGKSSGQNDKAAIQSRVLVLEGLDKSNKNAGDRRIYIHGTNKVQDLGKPASQGCFRLSNDDVIHLFNHIRRGTRFFAIPCDAWAPGAAPPLPPGVSPLPLPPGAPIPPKPAPHGPPKPAPKPPVPAAPKHHKHRHHHKHHRKGLLKKLLRKAKKAVKKGVHKIKKGVNKITAGIRKAKNQMKGGLGRFLMKGVRKIQSGIHKVVNKGIRKLDRGVARLNAKLN